ncbi:MAG: hypothetical protein ACR2I0_12735, partial [Rhodoferax sp.]
MKPVSRTARLFVEIVLSIAVAEVVVMWALPSVSQGMSNLLLSVLDVSMLVMLAGPLVYWRCLATFQKPVVEDTVSTPIWFGFRFGFRSAVGVTLAAQTLGIALTLSGVVWQKQQIETAAAVRFNTLVERVQSEIEESVNLPVYGLKG